MLRYIAILAAAGLHAQPSITTYAGSGAVAFAGDSGPATAAAFSRPIYLHADGSGNIYVADENNLRIRRINASGVVTTFAGNGARGFSGDGGPATQASLNGPAGLCGDAAGNIYINDVLNHRIRRVDSNGIITTFAGNGNAATSGDGGPAAQAGIWLPIRCAFNGNNEMFIAEQGGHRIRRISGGTISTVAGNGTRGFSGDNGPASAAVLDNPTAIAIDFSGNVFFSDQFNHRIRRINPAGQITTIAGTGTAGFAGDGGAALTAQLNFPGGLAVDQGGVLYVADSPNQRIRRIVPGGAIATVAGSGAAGFGGDNGNPANALLNGPFGLVLDNAGALYIADSGNNRIRRVTQLAPAAAPDIPANGVTNGASFAPGVSRGGLATIFGRHLSTVNGVVVTAERPWPVQLNGVGVTVNGTQARIYSLVRLNGQEQLSFQVPFDISGVTAEVVVNNNGTSATVRTTLADAAPGIFLIDAANGAFTHADFGVVAVSRPAARGEVLIGFLTGLGPVTPPVAPGAPAPGAEPLARTNVTPVVTIGGQTAQVLFSGLAPGFIGLYQINFQVPQTAPMGSIDVVIASGGVNSNTAKLEIR